MRNGQALRADTASFGAAGRDGLEHSRGCRSDLDSAHAARESRRRRHLAMRRQPQRKRLQPLGSSRRVGRDVERRYGDGNPLSCGPAQRPCAPPLRRKPGEEGKQH